MRTGASVICVFCVFCVTSVKLLSFSNNKSSPSLRMCSCDLFICCILPLKGSSFTIVGCRMRFGVSRSSSWLQFLDHICRFIALLNGPLVLDHFIRDVCFVYTNKSGTKQMNLIPSVRANKTFVSPRTGGIGATFDSCDRRWVRGDVWWLHRGTTDTMNRYKCNRHCRRIWSIIVREMHRDVFDAYAPTIQLIINSLRHTRRLLRLITTTAFLHRSKQLIHCDLSCH
eukprot:23654_1